MASGLVGLVTKLVLQMGKGLCLTTEQEFVRIAAIYIVALHGERH